MPMAVGSPSRFTANAISVEACSGRSCAMLVSPWRTFRAEISPWLVEEIEAEARAEREQKAVEPVGVAAILKQIPTPGRTATDRQRRCSQTLFKPFPQLGAWHRSRFVNPSESGIAAARAHLRQGGAVSLNLSIAQMLAQLGAGG